MKDQGDMRMTRSIIRILTVGVIFTASSLAIAGNKWRVKLSPSLSEKVFKALPVNAVLEGNAWVRKFEGIECFTYMRRKTQDWTCGIVGYHLLDSDTSGVIYEAMAAPELAHYGNRTRKFQDKLLCEKIPSTDGNSYRCDVKNFTTAVYDFLTIEW